MANTALSSTALASTPRATLESALRARNLDRTLTTALPPLERWDPAAYVPADVEALDTCLRSGLPRGPVSELVGPQSSGRLTLLWRFLAAATRRGEIVAFVDTCDRLDVASAMAAGIDLDRLLWIRGHALAAPQGDLLERTIDRALKSLNLVLQAGGFGVVAIDLADLPPVALKRLPFNTWLRVQRAVEGSDTACVLVGPEPLARSAGGVSLTLDGRTSWTGPSDRSRQLSGLDMQVRVISPRRRVGGVVPMAAAAPAAY